jgi:hypothetical protein
MQQMIQSEINIISMYTVYIILIQQAILRLLKHRFVHITAKNSRSSQKQNIQKEFMMSSGQYLNKWWLQGRKKIWSNTDSISCLASQY